MGVWWVALPVPAAITAFLPVAINAVFSLTDMQSVISCYSAELVFLLAGSDIISMAWETTGVDQRIAARLLALVGTSVKQQILIWFIMATLLSSVLPNTVVAAVMCSIAMSMLKAVGESDVRNSKSASLILLAIVYGANNGGMLTPLGGAMNLVTVSYIENLTGTEFLYSDWVVRMLPFTVLATAVTALFLVGGDCGKKNFGCSREHFRELCRSFPKLDRAGKASMVTFIAATVLAFTRGLYQKLLPDLKPGYIFLIGGLLMFFLKDEHGKAVVTWEKTEKNLMWGLFFLFSGGMALGALINGSGAADILAKIVSEINFRSEFSLIIAIVALNVILSDIVNNTACAAITIPIVISIAQGLDLPVIPYLWIATASYNLSFTLPTSIRSIPVGYGLDTKFMFRKGIAITACMIVLTALLGWYFVQYWPTFAVLS